MRTDDARLVSLLRYGGWRMRAHLDPPAEGRVEGPGASEGFLPEAPAPDAEHPVLKHARAL